MTKRPISRHGASGSSDTGTGSSARKPRNKTKISSSPCLSLDLEVGKKNNRIHAFAAVRPDTGQFLVFRDGNLQAELARLDGLADGASFLLGHNLIAFDLSSPCRRETRSATVKTPFG